MTTTMTTTTTAKTAVPTPHPPDVPVAPAGAAFTIRAATPADAEVMSDVFFDAFRDDEIARRVFPAASRRARAEMRRSFADDVANPECHKFVAVDRASGDVVAVTTWTPPGAAWDRHPPPEGEKEEEEEEEGEAHEKDADDAVDGEPLRDPVLAKEFFEMMDRKHGEHMGKRPHWTLGFLAVRRAWQGRGLTRPLVAWGLDRADRDGVEAYVQASPVAVPVYRRFGWDEVDRYVFSTIDYSEIFLIRKPRPLASDDGAAAVAAADKDAVGEAAS